MEQPGYITIQSKSDRKEWFNIYLYNDISSNIVNCFIIIFDNLKYYDLNGNKIPINCQLFLNGDYSNYIYCPHYLNNYFYYIFNFSNKDMLDNRQYIDNNGDVYYLKDYQFENGKYYIIPSTNSEINS